MRQTHFWGPSAPESGNSPLNGNKIWGLTALITADLLNICFNASIKTDLDLMRTYDDY